jgi:mannose-6-phosphate isomerase
VVTTPLRFVPFLRPMVWGGRRLGNVLAKPLPDDRPYGESWEVSDHPLHRSRVATGSLAGQTLRELMERDRPGLLGGAATAHDVFPWLVKLLDCNDWLSVQVHPDDHAVKRLCPGECGKTEAWFVLDAAPGSRIYAGLLPGTDEAKLREALAGGTVAECLHRFEPHPGDCLFLPAGTVHAVGGGVLLAEVQQTSDATFRLFDWNRRDAQGGMRPLHVEEALASIDWSRGPVMPIRVSWEARRHRQALVRCPYFSLDHVADSEPFTCGAGNTLRVLIVMRGSGRLIAGSWEDDLAVGQAWVLPAAMASVTCHPAPDLGVLLSSLPAPSTRGDGSRCG